MFEKSSDVVLTPAEFELKVKSIISASGQNLTSFTSNHLEVLPGTDGEYEIDVTARFQALDTNFLVLIECKRHSSPIKREVVQALHSKLNSTGGHKGIIFTTSGFQKGAVEFAKIHGIALVQLIGENSLFFTRSLNENRAEDRASLPPHFSKAMGMLISSNGQNTTFSAISSNDAKYLRDFLEIT